ncbi:MAG: DUF262 domain-containing protein [Dehalococcoidia bacterium]|nr:MAG: DUF262 domain-containing protein [Dehalococcoidia bacterium]
MRVIDITKTQFRISDFLGWARDGTLLLNPYFQRRPVWKPEAKSYFLDTVLRGLPAPIIYIRERVDLSTRRTLREVVDGQQRLRTILAFVEPSALADYSDTDDFLVREIHNPEFADTRFKNLPDEAQLQILGYEFSTHVLPTTVEDREVLQMFARLNSTGVRLNGQELRNAEWFGEFKTTMYDLGLEQLDRWRDWHVVSDEQISRMHEVEITSDLMMSMIRGITGKTQTRLDKLYEQYDPRFPGRTELSRRFRVVMDTLEEVLGDGITETIYTSEVHFYTAFLFLYDLLFGLKSSTTRRPARRLPRAARTALLAASEAFQTENVPASVLDAVRRASADTGRRTTRFKFLRAMVK